MDVWSTIQGRTRAWEAAAARGFGPLLEAGASLLLLRSPPFASRLLVPLVLAASSPSSSPLLQTSDLFLLA